MQVIVLLFILLFEAVLPFSGAIAATLKDSLSTSLNVYTDNADITVVNPNVSVFKTLSTHFMIGVKGAIDAVSAASIRTGKAVCHRCGDRCLKKAGDLTISDIPRP